MGIEGGIISLPEYRNKRGLSQAVLVEKNEASSLFDEAKAALIQDLLDTCIPDFFVEDPVAHFINSACMWKNLKEQRLKEIPLIDATIPAAFRTITFKSIAAHAQQQYEEFRRGLSIVTEEFMVIDSRLQQVVGITSRAADRARLEKMRL